MTHLTLDHYQTFEQLAPWKINFLLESLQRLQSLKISYVSPSFAVRRTYHLKTFQEISLKFFFLVQLNNVVRGMMYWFNLAYIVRK